ncbi:glycosyltransferase [Yersinia aleksiciae]|nr:glycosyltransferase [Yersinia aleksiciae]MDA5497731.1 glycosyltransferase [Yersinia aleksiciae]NIK98168.1 glycosyltransferase [Yersinia aleksiciae]WQC69824.1 glycosyltransferase [Yersinia aleksiciae]
MRVLYIITGLGMGGAEKQTCLIADRIAAAGHKVIIISLSGETLVKPNKNIPIIELSMKKNIFSMFSSLLAAKKIIKEFNPNVVHSHMFHANIFSRVLRVIVRVPWLVCSAHNTNEGNKLRMLTYRWTDKLASISTNVSKEAVDAFIQKGASFPGRMICVLNGIDTENFKYDAISRLYKRQELNVGDDTKMLLSVGRLTEAKDYPNLFKAFALLINNNSFHVKTKLYIVGDGHLSNILRLMTEKLGISNNVAFLGIRNDIPELMCAADVFILSSEWEGFGLVVAEAMACERAVVATDSGGVKEVLGDCGELVPISDHVSLSDSISKILSLSNEEKRELGISARGRVLSEYSIDTVKDNWINIYKGIY